jgi:hypothetical protein
MRTYAAKLENGEVTQVIVGDAQWATENLGGEWVPCEKYSDTETYPGIGYGYDRNHPRKFAPFAPPGLEKALNDPEEALPPDSLWFDNGKIDNIENIARNRGILTAQEARDNVPVRPERK